MNLDNFGKKILEKLQNSQNWPFLLGKYYKSCKMGKISCSESIWTTLEGKYWKSCKTAKIGHSESIQNTSVGKYWKS